MRIGLQEPDWPYIGAVLANSDADAQAAFFKALIKECNSWGTHAQVEMQFAFVNGKLTEAEREALSMLSYNGED